MSVMFIAIVMWNTQIYFITFITMLTTVPTLIENHYEKL
jgi:hypothetical protein